MIDGLKIEMTTDELKTRLTARIVWHEQMADHLEELNGGIEPEPARRVPRHVLEHEVREHREQAGVLSMLRDHLVAHEVYRLSELDLRFADLVVDHYYEPPDLEAEVASVS